MDSAPRGPRVVVNHPATLFDVNGKPIDCSILDVSRDGFRLRVPHPVVTGTEYTLHFDNQTHKVEIRWASPTEAGGLFINQIDGD